MEKEKENVSQTEVVMEMDKEKGNAVEVSEHILYTHFNYRKIKTDFITLNIFHHYVIDSYTKSLNKRNSKPFIMVNLYIVYPLLMDYIFNVLNILIKKYPDFFSKYENIEMEKFRVCINFIEYIQYRYGLSHYLTRDFKDVFPENIYSKCLSEKCPDLITFWNIFTEDSDIIGISLAVTVSREILKESFKDNFVEDSVLPIERPLLTFLFGRSEKIDSIMSSFIQENKKFIKNK